VVRELDANGNPIRGRRAIVDAEAAIVRRIFTSFAAGDSPLAIAKALNAERVLGPDGRSWRDTTIRGHALRGTGILRNELYVGRLVWNRMRYVKDPATGRRVSRMNPRTQWISEEVHALRIIGQDVWDRAQARLAGIRERAGADAPDRPRFWEKRRARGVLTGKVFCGCCGGTLSAVGKDYLACATARRRDGKVSAPIAMGSGAATWKG
jgi:site-specific DNA recombinase